MRQLTSAELELISGGSGDEDEIVVTGTPYPSPSPTLPAPWPGEGPGYPPPSSPSPTGPGPLPPATYTGLNCAVNALHTQVDARSDANSKEHLAIVYHNASGYHTSPLFTGTDSVGLTGVFNWMTANNVSFSQVVSLYHNHDSYDYATSSDEAAINRYLSINDWHTADYFISHGANASTFTMALEDTSHVTRDYSYSQESTYEHLTDTQMENGYKLPAKAPAC